MDLQEALRAGDRRVTRPRQIVWEVLSSIDRHLSAQEIADEVQARDPGINVSSVYRTLTLFAELDLVRESRVGDDAASRWETSHDDAVIHLVCSGCGVVTHHDAAVVDELRAQLQSTVGFDAVAIDVRVMGICADCT